MSRDRVTLSWSNWTFTKTRAIVIKRKREKKKSIRSFEHLQKNYDKIDKNWAFSLLKWLWLAISSLRLNVYELSISSLNFKAVSFLYWKYKNATDEIDTVYSGSKRVSLTRSKRWLKITFRKSKSVRSRLRNSRSVWKRLRGRMCSAMLMLLRGH